MISKKHWKRLLKKYPLVVIYEGVKFFVVDNNFNSRFSLVLNTETGTLSWKGISSAKIDPDPKWERVDRDTTPPIEK